MNLSLVSLTSIIAKTLIYPDIKMIKCCHSSEEFIDVAADYFIKRVFNLILKTLSLFTKCYYDGHLGNRQG